MTILRRYNIRAWISKVPGTVVAGTEGTGSSEMNQRLALITYG